MYIINIILISQRVKVKSKAVITLCTPHPRFKDKETWIYRELFSSMWNQVELGFLTFPSKPWASCDFAHWALLWQETSDYVMMRSNLSSSKYSWTYRQQIKPNPNRYPFPHSLHPCLLINMPTCMQLFLHLLHFTFDHY